MALQGMLDTNISRVGNDRVCERGGSVDQVVRGWVTSTSVEREWGGLHPRSLAGPRDDREGHRDDMRTRPWNNRQIWGDKERKLIWRTLCRMR